MPYAVKEIHVNQKDRMEVKKTTMLVLEFSRRSGRNHTTEFEKVDEVLNARDF